MAYVQELDDDLSYELYYIIKEIRKKKPHYNRVLCVQDILHLAVKEKDLTIKKILELRGGK